MGKSDIPDSLPSRREKTAAVNRNREWFQSRSMFVGENSYRRREIALRVSEVLGRIIAWDIPGESDERDRDYVRRRILDLKELTQFIEVILDDWRQHSAAEYRVLDVGTSLGILPLTLQSLDISASACDHPRFATYGEWIEKEGVSYATFDLMDGELPYTSGSFDVITFKQVIEHLPFSAKPTLKSFYRILRPGGLLLLSTPNIVRLSSVIRLLMRKSVHPPLEHFFESEFPFSGHFREYTLDEVKRMVTWCGFDVVQTTYLQQHEAIFLLRQRKRFANNLFEPIRWQEILALASWRPFTYLMPSLSQFVFVAARKPSIG